MRFVDTNHLAQPEEDERKGGYEVVEESTTEFWIQDCKIQNRVRKR